MRLFHLLGGERSLLGAVDEVRIVDGHELGRSRSVGLVDPTFATGYDVPVVTIVVRNDVRHVYDVALGDLAHQGRVFVLIKSYINLARTVDLESIGSVLRVAYFLSQGGQRADGAKESKE